MKRKINALFAASLVLLDALMASLAFSLAYRLRLLTEHVNIGPFVQYLGMMLVQIASILLVFFLSKMYHRKRVPSYVDEFSSIFTSVSVGSVVAIALISFLFKNEIDYHRLMMLYAWILTVILICLGRLAHARLKQALQGRGVGRDEALIIGTGEVGRMILQKIRHSPRLGYKVVGFIEGSGRGSSNGEKEISGVPVVGDIQDLATIIDTKGIDEVIIGLPEASHQEILNIISRCEREKVSIKVFPDVFQIMASEISIDDLGGLPLLTVRDIALRGWRLTLKRLVDLVCSAIGLVVLSPFMLLIALLIKLDSSGPVLYAQERMGLDANPFWTIKFRSMREDAEAATGPIWATENDPRCTRIGTFMRRHSIDEFPQLINVLLGEMSMVGPRPERPIFVEQFKRQIPRYMDRHLEKAGITGWAQVNGLRGDTSIVERTKYDLWYIENWSLGLDFKIMLRTILHIFSDRNAY